MNVLHTYLSCFTVYLFSSYATIV